MNEQDFGNPKPEGIETEPIHQTLRKNAESLGFIESEDIQGIRQQAVELSQTPQTEETERQFYEIMTQLQITGETIADQETPKTGMGQTGLMVFRAATLIECNRLVDALDELNDILDDLSYKAEGQPDLQPMLDELEEQYKKLNERL